MKIRDRILGAVADYDQPPTNWDGSTFEPLLELSAAGRGRIGEILTAAILKDFGCDVDDDQIGRTTRDGQRGYDLMADGIRLEVKLATRGKSVNTFQHENLNRREQWDALVLIDVAPENVYVKITAKNDLPWDDIHKRHSAAVHKYDMSVRKHTVEGNEITTDEQFFGKFREVKERLRRTES